MIRIYEVNLFLETQAGKLATQNLCQYIDLDDHSCYALQAYVIFILSLSHQHVKYTINYRCKLDYLFLSSKSKLVA